jgi:hypothetical protein
MSLGGSSYRRPGERTIGFESSSDSNQYAGCGVLVLVLPKRRDQTGDVRELSVRLVQNILRFSKDKEVRFFLAEPGDGGMDRPAG